MGQTLLTCRLSIYYYTIDDFMSYDIVAHNGKPNTKTRNKISSYVYQFVSHCIIIK